MKIIYSFLRSIPKEVIEVLSFLSAVMIGSGYKMIKKNESGIKITLKRMVVEAFASFFIALVVFAVFTQFLHFNTFFTYMMCSLAGSMDSLIHKKLEAAVDVAFNIYKKKV